MLDLNHSLVTGFHHHQVVRAEQHRVAVLQMAEQYPERLAALLRANPRMLNTSTDPEAVAKALSKAGYQKLCDDIAGNREVQRDIRAAFKGYGEVDWFTSSASA